MSSYLQDEYSFHCKQEKCNSMENYNRCKDLIMNKKPKEHDHDHDGAGHIAASVSIVVGLVAVVNSF